MSRDEFIAQAISQGLASRREKKRIEAWCDKNQKDIYTEDDLIELYRYLETPRIGEHIPFSRWGHYSADGSRTTKHYGDMNTYRGDM